MQKNWQADFYASPFVLFNYKFKKLKKALSIWSKATFGNIFQKISSLEEVVLAHEAQSESIPTKKNRERLQKVQPELIRYLALEEKFWKQKSGMVWFKDGDINTKFFHVQVKGRRKILQLNRIQNSLGNWIEDDEEIAKEAVKFYEDQFSETVPTSFHILDNIPTLVDMEQNTEIMKQPTKEEVKTAVFGLNGDNAGGPDGYIGKFYHT